MPLQPGTRLGPYEILAPLGAGGMGEVFRARDTRLGRDVAIKMLPVGFAADPERLARFEREARLLASLSHPNIAGILGLEEHGGTRYLILEFVDGETLEARLARGPLPVAEVLDVARQIATGLEAAHEAGIVHRDLKPGNIMLASNGGVKVLDFGLAKAGAATQSGSDPDLSASPTMTYAATQAGVILGTAAFMSPEQARGRSVDRRTDLWSFGCVLYECLTGRRAFEGDTVSDLVARILEREPDWSALPAATPPRLAALVRRCLVKDARQRQRDAGDVRLELDAIATGGDAAAGPSATAEGRRTGGLPRPMALVAIAALVVVAGFAGYLGGRAPEEKPLTLSLLAPRGVAFGRKSTDVVLSPDGQRVAFVAADSVSGNRLWVRDLSHDNARPLTGTDDADQPFWSPDGRSIGVFAAGKLLPVDVATGAIRTLAPAPLPRGGAWGRGVILFQPRSIGPLWRIPDTGGDPTVATTVDSAHGDIGHRFPQFFPDGKHFALTVVGKADGEAGVGTLGSPSVRHLFTIPGGGGVAFAAPGWLIAGRMGGVKAQRIDTRSLRLSGSPLDLPGLRIVSPYASGAPIVQASNNGSLVQRGGEGMSMRLLVVDRQGRTLGNLATPEGTLTFGNISPDGDHIAIGYATAEGQTAQIWTGTLPSGTLEPITLEGFASSPVISPDGRTIAFIQSSDVIEIRETRFDTPGLGRRIMAMRNPFVSLLGFAPDASGLLFRIQGTDTRQDLGFLSFADTSHVRMLLATRYNEPRGAISPDGKWLAYLSDESGRNECRVRPFSAGEGRVFVVSRGAWTEPNAAVLMGQPMWRRDGRELAYIGPDGHSVMSVSVTPGDPPVFGEPRLLFRFPSAVADITMSPGLDRFVLSVVTEEEGRSAATVLLHWPKLLEGGK